MRCCLVIGRGAAGAGTDQHRQWVSQPVLRERKISCYARRCRSPTHPLTYPTCDADLAWGIEHGDVEAVRRALQAGAPSDAPAADGVPPAPRAASAGELEVLHELLSCGASPNAADPTGRTALYLAAEGGHPKCVRLLADAGADVNAADLGSKLTPLHVAARWGETDCVRELLAAGASLSAVDAKHGRGPLHLAALGGCDGTLRELLAAGAEIETPDKAGRTALMLASLWGEEECARTLLDAGASTSAVDHDGCSAADLAEQRRQAMRQAMAVEGEPRPFLCQFWMQCYGCRSRLALESTPARAPPHPFAAASMEMGTRRNMPSDTDTGALRQA